MFVVVYPRTLARTVAMMYRWIHDYREDVLSFGWRSVEDVFHAVQGIQYVQDERAPECLGVRECLKRPSLTWVFGGDCDDKVILAGAGLLSLGVPFRIVTVSYTPDGEMTHTYLEVYVQGVWRPFDATFSWTELYREQPYTKKILW